MFSIKAAAIPDGGLINSYAIQAGCYTDCFVAEISQDVTLSDFILAFFNTPVFRLERLLLGLFASRPSTDDDVANLASGAGNSLALWKVDARDDNQLIMSVGSGPIRSWLMVVSDQTAAHTSQLYFGSAVLPVEIGPNGKPKIGKSFRIFHGVHKFYTRLLLWSTVRRLKR